MGEVLAIDFGKGTALHRLYGHYVFTIEAEKVGKDSNFQAGICRAVNCNGRSKTWVDHLYEDKGW